MRGRACELGSWRVVAGDGLRLSLIHIYLVGAALTRAAQTRQPPGRRLGVFAFGERASAGALLGVGRSLVEAAVDPVTQAHRSPRPNGRE